MLFVPNGAARALRSAGKIAKTKRDAITVADNVQIWKKQKIRFVRLFAYLFRIRISFRQFFCTFRSIMFHGF